jgi:hypothetical protein
MLDFLLENWNNALTILTFVGSAVLGYYQLKHIRAQQPSIEIQNITKAHYFQDNEDITYDIQIEVMNAGGGQATVTGGKLIFPPLKRYDPRRWLRRPTGDVTVSFSDVTVQIASKDTATIPFSESYQPPPIEDAFESRTEIDGMIVINTTANNIFTDITVRSPHE